MKWNEVIGAIQSKVSQLSTAVTGAVAARIYDTSAYKTAAGAVKSVSDFVWEESPTYRNVLRAFSASEEVRTIVYQAFFANLVKYALPVVAYEGYVRPNYIDGGGYSGLIDYPVKLIFCGMYICMSVNNAAYNISLSKSLTTFVPLPDKDHACKCIATSRASASFANVFHGIGINSSVAILSLLPKLAERCSGLSAGDQLAYAGSVAGAFAYGYALVALKYTNHGICARHIQSLVNNNKLYCFLLGATFLTVTRGGSYALSSLAGSEDNTFIYDAVFAHLYHYFILFSMLSQDTLIADKTATDIFHYHRVVVDQFVRSRTNKWVKQLDSQEGKLLQAQDKSVAAQAGSANGALSPDASRSYTQKINGYLNSKFVNYVASTTAISLLLSTHRQEIRQALESIIEARGYPLWVMDYLPNYLTPQSVRILANILKQQGWEDTRSLLEGLIKIALQEQTRVAVAGHLNNAAKPMEKSALLSPIVEIKDYVPADPEGHWFGEPYLVMDKNYFVTEIKGKDNQKAIAKSLPNSDSMPKLSDALSSRAMLFASAEVSDGHLISDSDDDFELVTNVSESPLVQEQDSPLAPGRLLRSASFSS